MSDENGEVRFTGTDGQELKPGSPEWVDAGARLAALRAREGRDAEGFIDKVLLSKPCSPVTRRAIELVTKYANTEVARLQRELNDAIANVQAEHRAALEQIAQDAAVTEGVDLTIYQLQAPGDVSPYWKPR